MPHTDSLTQPVTVSIARTVLPGRTRQASAWAHAGQELAREWPGYLGSGWVRSAADSDEWHMLYRFADADLLNDWEESEERRWWIDSAAGLVEVTQVERRTGIEGWFAQPGDVHLSRSRDRGAAAVETDGQHFPALFPLSLLANFLLHPLTQDWPLVLQVLLATCILTPLMTYIFLPATTRLLGPWLRKRRS